MFSVFISSADLKTQIDFMWNRFWAAGISNPLTAVEQISYLIFMKRLEDLDNRHVKAAAQPHTILYSTTNQYDTIGVARASDDVSPDTPTADET
ncbi:MAG: type I restriction-modification system subunit M N-terminal domain-containing protein [Nitrososphaeraceae archaeon]